MNHKAILLLFICSTTALNAMENTQQALVLPDWQAAHQTLTQDYQHYLQEQLETYKTSPLKMETLEKMSYNIRHTKPNYDNSIIFTKDADGNHFIHVAIEKEDTQAVAWLYPKGWPVVIRPNKKGKKPLDLLIEKFSQDYYHPHATDYEMLHSTLSFLSSVPSIFEHKTTLEESVSKIVALELSYQKEAKNLKINKNFLAALINKHVAKKKKQDALLTPFYKKVADRDGDTFTHVFVKDGCADELADWIQQERISDEKNNMGQTPLDIALMKFRYYTTNITTVNIYSTPFRNTQRCLFMLLDYYKSRGDK